jgi:cytoskeleton protein RodZ
MTDPAATTGPRLKAERERRGLSSQKAADELHLDGWVIDALEAEDYERIGPSVYAKGHLKRYAALLGLSSADIMAGYESRAQAPKVPPSPPANVRLRTDAPAVSILPWPAIVGLAVAVSLAIGVLWWKPWHPRGAAPAVGGTPAVQPSGASPDSATDPSAASPTMATAPTMSGTPNMPPASTMIPGSMTTPASPMAAAPSALPSAAPALPPGGAAATQAAKATPAPESDPMAGTGRARLRLSFSADSWVDVHDAAGRRVFAGHGRANSVKTIAGTAPMRVYLGFASGVQLEINNHAVAIGPQFMAGDIARFEAGADGILRRDSRSAAAPGAQTRNARPAG